MNDVTSDMIATIKNGQNAKLAEVTVKYSGLNKGVLEVLKDESFIKSYEAFQVSKGIDRIKIQLAYHEGQPVIKHIKRLSKPGLRKYSKITDLPKTFNGLGMTILSTPNGVLPDYQARKDNVGGELICEVF